MRSRAVPRSLLFWFRAAAVPLAVLGLGQGNQQAEAYRLYDNGASDYIVPASEAIRWSVDAWAPGSTLAWQIEEGPDWGLLLDHDARDFEPFVEYALSQWSEVRTADISWRLAGVRNPSGDSPFNDSRNQVFFDAESGTPGAFARWVRGANGAWEIAECDIGLPFWWIDWLERDSDAEDLERWAIGFLVRETAHCLGLGHAAELPASGRLRTSAADPPSSHWTEVWRPFPAMTYASHSLAEDDRVGASLLRPVAGWTTRVGAIAGVLESDGAPVPYAHVYALRRTAGGLRYPVGAFANARGEFRIEGLPPGDYVLWAHPLRFYGRHRPLTRRGAETAVRDTLALHPVRVSRGRVTRGIAITMRWARE